MADTACGAVNFGGNHGWPVCPKLLEQTADCVVYAIGIGMYPEFDQILASRYGCEVHSFDPSPTGRDAIAKLRDSGQMPPNMHYHELGISDFDGDLTLYSSLTGVMYTRECTERNTDVAVLVASGQLAPEHVEGCAVFGELSLTGKVRSVRGALAVAEGARCHGLARLVLPCERAREAA